MRCVIYGAGAIGGTIGGRLFEAGHDVTLIARGEHASALRTQGLELVSADSRVVLPVPTVEHPSEVEWAAGDVVILAMKSQDTPGALTTLAANAPDDVAVVCAQNGVENERVALRRFSRVFGMSVMCPATHLEPGRVLVHSTPTSGLLDVGPYPGGAVDTVATELAAALRDAPFESVARPDIMRWKWRKLIMNLANAPIAVCGVVDGVGELIKLVQAEGEACLAAGDIDAATVDEDKERREGRLTTKPVDGVDRPGGSSWQSLVRGAGTIETDYLTGEIILLGRLHGVPTPANALMQRLANQMAAAREAPGAYTPAEVLAMLG
jgi:2-dehydropantoate 2-reductase